MQKNNAQIATSSKHQVKIHNNLYLYLDRMHYLFFDHNSRKHANKRLHLLWIGVLSGYNVTTEQTIETKQRHGVTFVFATTQSRLAGVQCTSTTNPEFMRFHTLWPEERRTKTSHQGDTTLSQTFIYETNYEIAIQFWQTHTVLHCIAVLLWMVEVQISHGDQ